MRRTKKNIRDHVDSERKSLELLAWLVWIGDDHSGLPSIVVDARRATGWPCGISTCKLAVCVAKLLQWRADEWRQITSCSPRRCRRRRRLPRCNQQCSITTVTISDCAISVPRCNRHQQATQTQTDAAPTVVCRRFRRAAAAAVSVLLLPCEMRRWRHDVAAKSSKQRLHCTPLMTSDV